MPKSVKRGAYRLTVNEHIYVQKLYSHISTFYSQLHGSQTASYIASHAHNITN